MKRYKTGTIFSFKNFVVDPYDTLVLLLAGELNTINSKYYYILHFMDDSQEFCILDTNLDHNIKRGYWKIEYEPE